LDCGGDNRTRLENSLHVPLSFLSVTNKFTVSTIRKDYETVRSKLDEKRSSK